MIDKDNYIQELMQQNTDLIEQIMFYRKQIDELNKQLNYRADTMRRQYMEIKQWRLRDQGVLMCDKND